jgi:tetratricopeptide (TPR) repeat protein
MNNINAKSFFKSFVFIGLCFSRPHAAAISPTESVFKLQESGRFLDQGKTEEALKLIRSLHFYPHQSLKKYRSIQNARAILLKSPEEALALLQDAEQQGAAWNLAVKYAEAWAWTLKGDKDKAYDLLQDQGNPPELQLLKAKIHLALDQPQEGLSALEYQNDRLYDLTEVLVVKALLLRSYDDFRAIELLEGINFDELDGQFKDYLYLVLGKLYFEKANYEAAQKQWSALLQKFPHSPYRPDALYWTARIKEVTGADQKELAGMNREITLKYPDFAYADEVYFNQYSLKDYMQGDREAALHLDRFSTLHPNSPLTLVANYLIGLDKKEERRSAEGKTVRKKNLKESLQAFEQVQKLYDRLHPEELYYLHVKNLAALEKGRLCRDICQESAGPKKDIYRKYAIDALTPLVDEQRDVSSQAVLLLTEIWMDQGDLETAKSLISKELEKWEEKRGSAVVALLTARGKIYEQQADYETAWQNYAMAEESGTALCLGHDQELDLWIRQALCYQELGQYDQAMLLFSKAINKNVVSSQRLRAMYLRAEVYRRQGREELAKKQWEAVALKGGEWAQKAKKKLEE